MFWVLRGKKAPPERQRRVSGVRQASRDDAHSTSCLPASGPPPSPAPAPLPSAHLAWGQVSLWMWIFHAPIQCFTSAQLFLSLHSVPSQGEAWGRVCAGWVGCCRHSPTSASLILSGRVSWLWAPSKAAVLLLPPPLPPSPDRFNFHLSAACGRTD